jgi:hypothetical protein
MLTPKYATIFQTVRFPDNLIPPVHFLRQRGGGWRS